MGKRAARFLQGRLLMHGADPATPVTVVASASRPDQQILSTTLSDLEPALTRAAFEGPALILFGLAPRRAEPNCRARDASSGPTQPRGVSTRNPRQDARPRRVPRDWDLHFS